jgi:hypothetical protein
MGETLTRFSKTSCKNEATMLLNADDRTGKGSSNNNFIFYK